MDFLKNHPFEIDEQKGRIMVSVSAGALSKVIYQKYAFEFDLPL